MAASLDMFSNSGTDIYSQISSTLGVSGEVLLVILMIFLIWKLFWYALAIYSTIEKKQKSWFVALFIGAFVLGDLGILAIVYLILEKNKKRPKKRNR